jgi:bis(5'-nucleosyl)-tetraphosphatase (symmetrical)
MATYAIGDIQGCYLSLGSLLRRIPYRESADELWLVGDLVNRGPASLEVLRWVRDQGENARMVLGNHDLHLLARAFGVAEAKELDTLDEVLDAPDSDDIVDWLLQQPLIVRDRIEAAPRAGRDPVATAASGAVDRLMVHGGLHPSWSADQAVALARVAESLLEANPARFLRRLRKAEPYHDGLEGEERVLSAARLMTRIRACSASGELSSFAGPPERIPSGYRPWFEYERPGPPVTVVFGHWSALGLSMGDHHIGVDTGCVWGGSLTAVRLEDRAVFRQPALEGLRRG